MIPATTIAAAAAAASGRTTGWDRMAEAARPSQSRLVVTSAIQAGTALSHPARRAARTAAMIAVCCRLASRASET
jgi:hypothetical protein